jgi:hypothetical protein
MVNKDDIKARMEVFGSDGRHIGVVDSLEGDDQIKLTRSDPMSGGKHHFIALELVARVDEHVHLKKPSKDVMAQW